MEESSEKRRERLQAMRAEASAQSQPLSSPAQSLSNPLLSSSAADERTPQAARFDFYTDPVAAFSGSKRRNPSAAPYGSPESFSSPMRSRSPLPYQLNGPSAGYGANYHGSSRPAPGLQLQPNQPSSQSPWRSPIHLQTPFSGAGTPPSYTPNPNSWNRPGGGSPGRGYPPSYSSRGRSSQSPMYSSRGRGSQSPNFTHGGSPSPYSNSGRGGGRHFRGRGGGGRGQFGGHDRCSLRYDRQHQFKAMMKDPWRKLTPIIGSILVPRSGSGSGSWLPKSIAMPKRAKVAESGGGKSQLSLAESLALAMEEAVDDV